MKKFWQDNFLDNPFMLDTRRVFGFGSKSSAAMQAKVAIGMLLAIFGLMTVLLIYFAEVFAIEIVSAFHLFIVMMVAPATCYMSYAAEVEKRTWDFVMVSPISSMKIMIGKLIPAIFAISLVQVLSVFFYGLHYFIFTFKGLSNKPLSSYVLSNLFCLVVGIFVISMVTLISLKSSRVRVASTNGFVATFALLFLGPLFAGITQIEQLSELSPMQALSTIYNPSRAPDWMYFLSLPFQLFYYLIGSVIIFSYIYRNVRTK